MGSTRSGAAVVVVALLGSAANALAADQPVTGPVAVYWMSAATTSGMGGLGGPGGEGRPDPRAMMAMAFGGANPNTANHSLVLQLGSSRSPAGGIATAEHDPPEGLAVGPVLPLLSPRPQAAPAHEESEPGPPPQFQQPHGRMLIFWGCGEHAGPGQPLVIDFANAATGGGQQFMALARGLDIRPMQPPSPGRNTTYGEWPNEEAQTSTGPTSSLQGAHFIHGDYTPDIRFQLSPDQDFLAPFTLTTNEKSPTGAGDLAWRAIGGAGGYFATMVGGAGRDQVVMWTSSASQASAFSLPDYLGNSEIARLVAARTLMPASQTQCYIPVEAMAAAGRGGFFNLVAYGGETNISYPPRPPAPAPWNISWEVKVRYRSATSGVVGMDMSRMMGGGGDQPPPTPPKRHGFFPSIPTIPGVPGIP